MTKNAVIYLSSLVVAIIILSISVIGMYNSLQYKDELVSSSWAEVTNQYQRRADLIPSLVAVVKGYASHEKETLEGVAQARASATAINITPALINDPKAMAKFQQVQGDLTNSLSKLMMVQEKYPDLKADKQFQGLQSQIEGTENRITVARNRYIAAVNTWDLQVRQFPSNLVASSFGYTTKAQFSVENASAASVAPKINFN